MMEDIFLEISAKDWAEIIRNYALAGAATITAWVAVQGLSTWKRQESWTENKQLSKRILTLVYRIREAIRDFRSPFVSASEMEDASEGKINFRNSEDKKLIIQKAYIKRYARITESFEELYSLELEAKAVWGKTVCDHLKELRRHIIDLKFAIEESHVFEAFGALENDERKENRKIIYRKSIDDEFAIKVDKTISKISEYLFPYLGRNP
ncbi:hypothetical protein N9M10_00425 [Hellea sp.]|nr:hypothetical protein [Hellea sp.]